MEQKMLTKPVLALRGVLILPGMIANIDVGRDKSIAAINAVMELDKQILLVGQMDNEKAEITTADLYGWGVLAEVKQRLQLPSGAIRLLVEGLARVKLTETAEVHNGETYFVAVKLRLCAACCLKPLAVGQP